MRETKYRKRVIEPRDERHIEKPINRVAELKVVIWGSLGALFLVSVFFLLRSDDEGNWSSAAPGTIDVNIGAKSDEDSFPIDLNNNIQSEEANAIVIAYMKYHTGIRPSMALNSALPSGEGQYWHMDLYYLDEEEAGDHANRRVLVHKLTGDVSSQGLGSMTLRELAEKSALQIQGE